MHSNDSTEPKHEAFMQSNATGSPCKVCGWKEGDGVMICFYDADLGSLRHQNKHPTGLTAEQAALYGACSHPQHGKLYFESDSAREEEWARYNKFWDEQNEEKKRLAERYGWDPPSPEQDRAARQKYRETLDAYPTAEQLPAGFEAHPDQPGWVLAIAKHPGCGGSVQEIGPYHFGCTGCGVDVRLWEHGIDYDVG